MEKNNQRLEVIEFIKGYSILTIVLYHLLQYLKMPGLLAKSINFGGTGIHTFLMVSGFGLYLSHLNKPLDFIDFMKKRFVKIYVPYFVTVTIVAAFSLLVLPVYDNSLYAYCGHIFLYKMFDESIIGSYGYQLWFISTIIQLYLVFLLLVKLKEKMSDWLFLLSGVIISVSWSLFLFFIGKDQLRVWDSFFLQFLWEFMLGMLFGSIYYSTRKGFWQIPKSYLYLLAVVSLGFYAFLALKLNSFGQIIDDIPALTGYLSLCLIIYSWDIKLLNRFIFFTASVSFPLYLCHMFVRDISIYLCKELGISYNIILLLLVLVICYMISFYLEKFIKRIYIWLKY
ncbi:MAG TPA: acyltransferase family protein [Puia sp.]|nr:acyltransferase family protein [Puia sp.]